MTHACARVLPGILTSFCASSDVETGKKYPSHSLQNVEGQNISQRVSQHPVPWRFCSFGLSNAQLRTITLLFCNEPVLYFINSTVRVCFPSKCEEQVGAANFLVAGKRVHHKQHFLSVVVDERRGAQEHH